MAFKKFRQEPEKETEINLSAMIDCIFILLIFFIVTTKFVEESGIDINKPDIAASTPDEENENITIEITGSGKVVFEEAQVTLSQLRNLIANRVKNPDTPVSIRANGDAPHGVFVQVWDTVSLGGAEKISFSTVN